MTSAIPTMTGKTWGILTGQEYLHRFMGLEKERISRLFANDISIKSIKKEGALEMFNQEIKGKIEVQRFFYDHYFNIMPRSDLRKATYKAFDTHVQMTYEVHGDILVDGILLRSRRNWSTQLVFRREFGGVRIGRIHEENSQNIIPFGASSSTAISSTKAVGIAQKYINRSMHLKEQRFYELLSADIHMQFTTTEDASASVLELRGKDEAEKVFHREFFSVTNNFDLREVSYEYMDDDGSGDDGVRIRGIVDEDRIESNAKNRYSKVFFIRLKFKNEEDVLKICSIWASKHQHLMSSSSI